MFINFFLLHKDETELKEFNKHSLKYFVTFGGCEYQQKVCLLLQPSNF